MKLVINRQSKVPLAQQIHQAIADRILSGHLERGARLPSVRQLAKMLQVSPVTVVHALDLLEAEGLITRVHGKGTFVYEEHAKTDQTTERQKTFPVVDYLYRSQYWQYQKSEVPIDFAQSVVHPSLLPTQALADSIRRLIREEPDVLVQYGEIQGDLALRQALARYISGERITASAHEILVTNGSQQAIDLVARSFVGPQDVVVTEEPTYTAAIDAFRSRGATVLSVPVDEHGMRIDELIGLLDRCTPKLIYTIPSFHNPTGSVMSVKRRRELIAIASEVNCLVLEDDPWSEIHFDEPPPPHLKSMDETGNVIYIKGLGKILSPGCRIGFLIATGPVLERLVAAKTNADLGNPLLNQRVILPLFENGSIRESLRRLRETLRERRNLTLRVLERHAPDGVTWKIPKGGFNVWVSLPEGANANELLADAEKVGIRFLPGSACDPNQIQWRHLRISFSPTTEADLEQGLTTLCHVMERHLSLLVNKKGKSPLF
jgi:DNA-binding transcriptional MocR family regulator